MSFESDYSSYTKTCVFDPYLIQGKDYFKRTSTDGTLPNIYDRGAKTTNQRKQNQELCIHVSFAELSAI
jgi:hypothetical protein